MDGDATWEYLVEFWQNGNTNMRLGKTAETKQIVFWSPEDEKMFLAHGYPQSLWDEYIMPHDILVGLERRNDQWRMKCLKPADDRPTWCDNPSAKWVGVDKLKPGMLVYTSRETKSGESIQHRLVRVADDQRKDDRVIWIIEPEVADGTYPETTVAFYRHYQYLVS